MKILIVDDNADDRKVLRYNLENHGIKTVIEAQDGLEGLELAKAHKPDLIISDALMPTIDGFQFLRSIKTDETLQSVPFIFYSAVYTGYREAELATSLGAEAFIIKPKDPEEFWEEVIGILEECKLRKPNGLTAELIKEEEFLKKYSHIVAAKLEEKVRELEKAKAAVEAKEQEWQTTFDSIGDCVTIHDRDFNVLLANKPCEKLLGASQKEIRSRKCFELFHGKNGPHEACPKLNTEQTGRPFETEMFEPRLNCWLSITCFPLLDKDGAVRGVVHFARDITQRKKMERDLRKSEEKYRTLVDDAPVGVYRSNPAGEFLYVNDAMVKIFECDSVEEMLKTPVLTRYKTSTEREMFVEKIRKEGKVKYLPFVVPTKTGGLKNIVISATFEHEVISGMVLDMTEQKKLEDQLRHAQKMEAVGTLAGGIAHDFNNILNVIMGFGTMVMDRIGDDQLSKEQMNEVLTAADRAATLTKRLLIFSRKQVVEVQSVNINELILGLQKMLARIIRENIDFTLDLAESPLIVLADAGQIEQVLMNLASNAKDAMLEGGRLTIGTALQELDDEYVAIYGYGKPGRYALITVADTGQGMDEEIRKKIFEPFFTTKGIGEGTGLGLAISYGIIKQHNGYIKVYSEFGKGTEFKIYLPLIEETGAQEKKTEAAVSAKGGNETILLAEDDASLRKLSRIVLESAGYYVITAEDGEDAVTKFMENRERISLALIDMIMPKKNGKEVAAEIIKMNPQTKILFASGYTMDIIKTRELTESGFDFIFKPVLPRDLIKKVREILDR